jgi:hypothetical protein
MNLHASILLPLGLGLALPTALTATPILLNTDPVVQANASYLYFNNASGTPFLSQAYYPAAAGPVALRNGDGSYTPGTIASGAVDDAWIPFPSGDLTDNNSTSYVTGWTNFTTWQTSSRNLGPYILFDLGAEYSLSQVDITLTDKSGQRWYAGTDFPQRVWTATELSAAPGTGTALSSSDSFWTQKVSFAASVASTTHTYQVALNSEITARYVLLLMQAGTVDGSNTGGIIRDVNFHGVAIPEPSTAALGTALAVLGFAGTRRTKLRR